ADRIVAMGDGQVVETGTPAEILRPEVLERIFKTPCSVVDGPHGPLAVYY
ncbi:iron ABC transporter ATP-binding protein, partial [Micrococcus luteus]|nr:iron ABC transporter ATP-binding protein [Micrococcus luteus]